jgi:hypothetical protein
MICLSGRRLAQNGPSDLADGRKRNGAYQLPVGSQTMTGARITTNSTGKMHTIIGTASLAGRLYACPDPTGRINCACY